MDYNITKNDGSLSFSFMCMSALSSCTSVHHVHEVSVQVRRGRQIPGGSGVAES